MRILIVAEQPEILEFIRSLVEKSHVFVIQYNHPLKALDNLEEILPDLILWDAKDFPRHWKICKRFCEASPSLSRVKMVLVSESKVPEDEVAKAESLGLGPPIETGFFSDEVAQLCGSQPDGGAAIKHGPKMTALTEQSSVHFLSPKSNTLIRARIHHSAGTRLGVKLDREKLSEFEPGMILEHFMIASENKIVEAVVRVSAVTPPDILACSLVEIADEVTSL